MNLGFSRISGMPVRSKLGNKMMKKGKMKN